MFVKIVALVLSVVSLVMSIYEFIVEGDVATAALELAFAAMFRTYYIEAKSKGAK